VLAWRKTRLRVAWSLGIASRQWRNIYRLLAGPHTESSGQPTGSVQASKKEAREVVHVAPMERSTALAVLAAVAMRRMQALRVG
jgi:hypothetical protein